MAFGYGAYPDMPPGLDKEGQIKHWNGFAEHHNRFAETFNSNRLNRLLKKQIPLAPIITLRGRKHE